MGLGLTGIWMCFRPPRMCPGVRIHGPIQPKFSNSAGWTRGAGVQVGDGGWGKNGRATSDRQEDGTGPNPERCNCQTFRDCRITALEQRRKGFSSLPAKRLENHAKWNLLRLPWAPDWWGLHRVSILFPTVEARYKFSGGHCDCRKVTEGDVSECVSKQHQGLLGLVKVYHRRQMILWQDQRDKLVEVDSTGWPGWVGP